METPNFKAIFEGCGESFVILSPNSPEFNIIAVSEAFLKATNTQREDVIGKPTFTVFPDNPNDTSAEGVSRGKALLETVLATKTEHRIPIIKYSIKRTEAEGGGFEERYWDTRSAPILDEQGNVLYLLHHSTDVTLHEHLIHQFGGTDIEKGTTEVFTQVERLNKLMVSRELKMVELKKELAKCMEGKVSQ